MPRVLEINHVVFDRLIETYPNLNEQLENETFRDALSAVVQASDFLTRFIMVEPAAIETLSSLDTRHDEQNQTVEELVRWKQLEMLRIAARDLTGVDQLETVGYNLARLGQDVLSASLRLVNAQDELVVIGMGKLGGNELNYASDVDIMFVGETDDSLAREVMNIARQCFRIDAALRPEGRDGLLVRSLESYESYWSDHAQTWEFQALLKARPVAGNDDVAEEWRAAADNTLWSRPFGADQLREVREMKARVEYMIAKRGLSDREVKRGRGGIRDIEFAVQLLQLVHGETDTHIRSANTLTALQQLNEGGYIADDDTAELSDSYRFLRAVEHRLQLVDEQQTHTIPTDRASRSRLASSMNYEGDQAVAKFDDELRRRQSTVRHAHEKLYFRPLLEAFANGNIEPGSAIDTQLAAFGFTDAQRTRAAVKELTRGLARSSRLMQQLMPLIFDWLSASPDPDQGLLGLRSLIEGFRTPTHLINVFRDSPEAARRMCLLLGTSKIFIEAFSRHPELIVDLSDDALLVPNGRYIDRMRVALGWRKEEEERHVALLRLARAEQMRIACADVLGLISDAQAAERRTDLADAVLDLSLEDINCPVPLALIAMGRYGGRELGYASDLDVVVVHDGKTAEHQQAAEKAAQLLLSRVSGSSGTPRLYDIDYDLRPEGKKGVLARSLESCTDYYSNWASTWERQALLRARFAAGDDAVSHKFMDIANGFIWNDQIDASAVREIRHLKARMETERIPRGGDREFHLKLGSGSLSDVEWTVQLLQLQNGVKNSNTIDALNELLTQGLIELSDARILDDAWRFCDFTRNRLFIVTSSSNDALPADLHQLAVLARSLEIPELRERYKQVTRRCRSVMERLFYGQADI